MKRIFRELEDILFIEDEKEINSILELTNTLQQKFYRIEAIILSPDGPLIDFIAKANSSDPDSLEFIVDTYGNTSENIWDYICEQEVTDIIETLREWEDQFWYSDYVRDDSFGFEMEYIEITEEEYNNAEDKWKDAKIERSKIVY
jgi:hypothetical protein